MMIEFADWAIEQHEAINHLYDGYIPYRFHLKMVALECDRWRKCAPKDVDHYLLYNACYGHDLLEDCSSRVNYSDIERVGCNKQLAEIIYAVTDEKGRNRSERHAKEYWWTIRQTDGAAYIKLCDRLANVRYSKYTMNTSKLKMYRKEQEVFKLELDNGQMDEMWQELEKLLEI